MKQKIILGIESSCDDTGIGIITEDKAILSNIVISQFKEHEIYKGVVPEIASRSHMSAIKSALTNALAEAKITLDDIDAIAATGGPGLIGGVIVGTMFAKGLAMGLKKPYLAINHLEGHLLSPRITTDLEFPYLMLLVSGGHCQFIAVLGLGKYKILGQTIDDAVGEAFDKTGKLLGLDYPAGPLIEKLALTGDPHKFKLPMPLAGRDGCDFSFSGLKTAVRELIRSNVVKQMISFPVLNYPPGERAPSTVSVDLLRADAQVAMFDNVGIKNGSGIEDICASFQYTISKILNERTKGAIKIFSALSDSKNFAIAGGVAANLYLRTNLEEMLNKNGFKIHAPPMNLCTDNGIMIAWAGMERFKAGCFSYGTFCPRARWSLEEITCHPGLDPGSHGMLQSKITK